MRVSINVKSNKGIPISSKIVQDNAKEEKAKILKNRLGFWFKFFNIYCKGYLICFCLWITFIKVWLEFPNKINN